MVASKILVVLLAFIWHPYHVGTTNIFHNAKEKTLEVSVKLLTGDFEKAIKKDCNCPIDLTKPADKKNMEDLVTKYISSHLQVKLDETTTSLHFIGSQQEEESTWCYFEVKEVEHFNKAEVRNSLLYDIGEEQMNIIRVQANGNDKTGKIEYPEKELIVFL